MKIIQTKNRFKKTAYLRQYFKEFKKGSDIPITPDIIRYIIEFKVSQEVIDLCANIMGVTYSVPWRKRPIYPEFKKNIGTAGWKSSLKTIGVYVLRTYRGHTYVGNRSHISVRIRSHLLRHHPTTRRILQDLCHEKSKVILYIIDSTTMRKAEDLGLRQGRFLAVLEQYHMIRQRANVNKVLVRWDSSYRRPKVPIIKTSLERTMESSTRIELFCYEVKDGCFFLIYVVPRIALFAKMANKSQKWLRVIVHEKNGYIAENFVISESPVKNSIEALIETEVFEPFLLKNIPLSKNQLHIYLSLDHSEVVEGPFSKAQVCKKIGCTPKTVNKYLNSNKKYHGYIIFTK